MVRLELKTVHFDGKCLIWCLTSNDTQRNRMRKRRNERARVKEMFHFLEHRIYSRRIIRSNVLS